MTLPVKGLTDEELEGYASLHPEAATELAERIAKGAFAKDERMDDLERQLASAEDELDDIERRYEDLQNTVRKVLGILEDMADDDQPEDRAEELKEAIRLLDEEL